MISHEEVAVEGIGYGHLSVATQGWISTLEEYIDLFFEFSKVVTSYTFYAFCTFFSYLFKENTTYAFSENEFYKQQIEFEVKNETI